MELLALFYPEAHTPTRKRASLHILNVNTSLNFSEGNTFYDSTFANLDLAASVVGAQAALSAKLTV